MAYYVDSMGRLVEAEPRTPEELAALTAKGFMPALDSDIQRHNIRQADEGGFSGTAFGEAATRGLATVGEGISTGVDVATDALGLGPEGLVPEGSDASFRERAEARAPEAFGDEARLRSQAHPFSSGLGTAAVATPLAIPAGIAAGTGAGALGAGALLATGTGIVAEAAVEAVAQEYEDAWLQERPMALKNVAMYTAMFGLGDVLFRGVIAGAKWLLGGRDVVSEANQKLRKEAGPLEGRPRSVGAASAKDLDDPFDQALTTMSERDAAILDRDADDYLNLVSSHAADEMNRVRRGLDEDLSGLVKYQDFEQGAKKWTQQHLEAQASWLTEVTELGQELAGQMRKAPSGDVNAVDFGNLGRAVSKTVDDFTRRLDTTEGSGARLNYLVDELKKRLDSHMVKVDASFSVDNVTKSELKGEIRPFVEKLRKGLEDTKLWGDNAKLQRELNPGWHELLKHWSGIQQKLYERTGEVLYDHTGAGRVVMEATTRRMFDLLQQDPRMRREMGQHLSGAFDGLTQLIDARKRNGIVRRDNLDNLLEDIASLKEDWNLASTVGVARNQTGHLKKDPRKWANVIREIAGAGPGVVGRAAGAVGAVARGTDALGRIQSGTRLTKGSAIADVWDRGLGRYAKHPDLADPSISRNYSEWLREALKEHGGKVAGVGLLGLASQQESEEGQSMAGVGVLALMGGKSGRMFRLGARSARKAGEEGFEKRVASELGALPDLADWKATRAHPVDVQELHVAARKIVNERLSTPERVALKEYTAGEYAPTRAVEALVNRGAPLDAVRLIAENPELLSRMPTINPKQAEVYVHQAVKRVPELLEAAAELSIDNPTKNGPLFRGVSVDADGLSELLTRDEFVTHSVTSTSFDPLTAAQFAGGDRQSPYGAVLRFKKAAMGAVADNPTESEVLLPPGAKFRVTGRQKIENGTTLLVDLEQVGTADPARASDAGVLAALLAVGGESEEGQSLAGAGLLAFAGRRGLRRAAARGARESAQTVVGRSLAPGALSDPALARRALVGEVTPPLGREGVSAVGPSPSDVAPEFGQAARVDRGAQNIPADTLTPHVGSIPQMAVRESGPLGKTPAGWFRGADGVRRYVKLDKDPAHSAIEAGNAAMYNALGRRAPVLKVVDLPDGTKITISEDLGPQWKELGKIEDWSELPPTVAESYAKGVPVDIIMGNWDVSRNAGNILTDGTTTAMIDAGEAGANAWGASWFRDNYPHTSAEVQRTAAARKGLPFEAGFIGSQPTHSLLRGFTDEKAYRGMLQESFDDAVGRIEAAGGPEAFVRKHQPTLSDGDVRRAGREMAQRIAAVKGAIPVLGGLLYVAFGGGDASAAELPDAAPEERYRRALEENARGGAAMTTKLGHALVAGKPGKGRSAPQRWLGARSPGRATESVREVIRELSENPAAMLERVAGSVGDLARTHPGVYSEMVAQSTRMVSYLQAMLPRRRGQGLTNPEGRDPSFDELDDFAARVAGTLDPVGSARDVAAGRSSLAQREALAAMWPEWWEQLRASVLGYVTRSVEEGGSFSPERLGRLDRELGLGGQLDPLQSQASTAFFLQALDAGAQGEQAAQGGAGQSAGGGAQSTRYQTRLGAARAERAMQ